ncbi:MAG: tRNA(Met) cytidine acetyltransferase TmcA domain-containing protein, partial [Zestosphaera sp.]
MKYKELQEKLKEVASTREYRLFLKNFLSDIEKAYVSNERRLVVLCGSDSVKVAGLTIDLIRRYVRKLRKLRRSAKLSIIHVFHDEFPDARLRATLIRDLMLSKKLVDAREVT